LTLAVALAQSALVSSLLSPCLAFNKLAVTLSSGADASAGEVDARGGVADDHRLISKSDEVVKTPSSSGQDTEAAKPLLSKSISKPISKDSLSKIASISVTVQEQGKTVKYSGVPLRALLKEEVSAIDEMPEWKKLAKQKIMLEVLGKDGFPALMSAVEVATNQSGNRFVLATEEDGKPMESIKLICPNDEHHTRWVRDCEELKLFCVDQ